MDTETAFFRALECQFFARFGHGHCTDLFQTPAEPAEAIRIMRQENSKIPSVDEYAVRGRGKGCSWPYMIIYY